MTGSATQRGSVSSTSIRTSSWPGNGSRSRAASTSPLASPAVGSDQAACRMSTRQPGRRRPNAAMICWVASLAALDMNPTRSTRAARLAAALVSRSTWSQSASMPGVPAGQRLACRGEGHPGPGPGEQLHPELALQLLDLLGQRRLGHEQPLRRAGEASFGRDGGEVAQQPGVDIHAIRL